MADKIYKSYDGHGVDVASMRADDLDRDLLAHLQAKEVSSVIDLGCGAGGQSVRMAQVRSVVVAIDSYDFSELFEAYRTQYALSPEVFSFIQGDIAAIADLLPDASYTDAVMQRTLHYLPYAHAQAVLLFLHEVVADRLYISVTGMNAAIASTYAGKHDPIQTRFQRLDTQTAQTFHIQEPVCLYTRAEFIQLLTSTHWKVSSCWESAFGNIKAVCTHG